MADNTEKPRYVSHLSDESYAKFLASPEAEAVRRFYKNFPDTLGPVKRAWKDAGYSWAEKNDLTAFLEMRCDNIREQHKSFLPSVVESIVNKFRREHGLQEEVNDIPLGINEPDATGVKQTLGAIKPGKVAERLALPLNELVGDCVGSRLSPEALAAGALDLGIYAGHATPASPAFEKLKAATQLINGVPRAVSGDDFWENTEVCKEYREQRDAIKRNFEAQKNKLIDLFKPPIPYIDY